MISPWIMVAHAILYWTMGVRNSLSCMEGYQCVPMQSLGDHCSEPIASLHEPVQSTAERQSLAQHDFFSQRKLMGSIQGLQNASGHQYWAQLWANRQKCHIKLCHIITVNVIKMNRKYKQIPCNLEASQCLANVISPISGYWANGLQDLAHHILNWELRLNRQ